MIKRLVRGIVLVIVGLLVISMPVLAAVAYRAPYTIIESDGSSYDMLAVIEDEDNEWLADNGFIEADALDTRIQTLGGSIKPHMVSDEKTLTAVPVPANSQTNLNFTTANTDLASMHIIEGYGGLITIYDDAPLELGNDFEIEQSGYIDTTGGADVNLVYKQDAFRSYIDGATNISSEIFSASQTTPTGHVDPGAQWNNEVNAYDDNTVTYAEESNIPIGTWSEFLELTHAAIYIDGLRFYASGDDVAINQIDVDAFYGGIWNHVYEGAFTWNIWETKYLASPTIVTAVRVRLYNSSGIAVKDGRLHEVDFSEILKVTAPAISSDEYTVRTYGVDNEPQWATGDVLHFTGANDSNVNAGAIHNVSAKLWISLWFNLDSDFSAASGADLRLSGKFVGGADYIRVYLDAANGALVFASIDGGVWHFLITVATNWNADQWYNVIASMSDVAGMRLRIDGGVAVVNAAYVDAVPNGGDFVIGDGDDPGAGTGFIGEIQNVIVGTDDLSPAEEATLYAGTAPGDETNYWYIDEGTGTTTIDYGTGGNDGTIDAAPTWETSTFTTGSTGRLCDFYIEVDDGVLDPDRWGANMKGASVPDNVNDWILNQNNAVPWMDYYQHTVGGVLIAWYQPIEMVINTSSTGDEDNGGSAVLITDAGITEGVDYWIDALVTITEAGGVAPEGEARIVTASAVGSVTVTVPFSVNIDIGDDYIVEFGTLVDRQGADEPGRITWGINPSGVAVTMGAMVSVGQSVPGIVDPESAQDILPEAEVSDWFIEPDVSGTLLTYPLRPFVTMWSDNSALTELQCWRIYALALILLVTVATGLAVGSHQGITMIAAAAAILAVVVMTIVPMWALVFAIGMFIGGLVMERSPSL